MRKKYQSLGIIQRSINITVDGKNRVIMFTGGTQYPKKICGTYITDDEKEQKAIESHHNFGKTFELITTSEDVRKVKKPEVIMDKTREINVPVVEKPVKNVNIPVEDQVDEQQPEDPTEEIVEDTIEEKVEESKHEFEEVFEIEKVQDAKEYLMKRFEGEFTHRHLSNKTKVIEAATEKRIKFPNLQ